MFNARKFRLLGVLLALAMAGLVLGGCQTSHQMSMQGDAPSAEAMAANATGENPPYMTAADGLGLRVFASSPQAAQTRAHTLYESVLGQPAGDGAPAAPTTPTGHVGTERLD